MDLRLKELDALRGIVALIVVFHHFMLSLRIPDSWLLKIFNYSPLHILYAGRESVIFFFILSGFVLSLPYLKANGGVPYPGFLVKRICRIYLPYLVALLTAILMNYLFLKYFHGRSTFSAWFNLFWHQPVDLGTVVQHVLFIGAYDTDRFNYVIWSLVHEMRISLIFPCIMLAILRFSWKTNLGLAFLLSAISLVFARIKAHGIVFYGIQTDMSGIDTIGYMSMFVIGALLAQHWKGITRRISGFNQSIQISGLILAAFLFTNPYWLTHWGIFKSARMNQLLSFNQIKDWGILSGVALFMMIALSSDSISNILRGRILQFLGKISYSLYLYHAICILTLFNLFSGGIGMKLLVPMVFVSIMAVASIAYYAIEVPSIHLGKFLASRIDQRLFAPIPEHRPPDSVCRHSSVIDPNNQND
jgi:peptidoglycan/LPS O-acetylase OafA/YrhL